MGLATPFRRPATRQQAGSRSCTLLVPAGPGRSCRLQPPLTRPGGVYAPTEWTMPSVLADRPAAARTPQSGNCRKIEHSGPAATNCVTNCVTEVRDLGPRCEGGKTDLSRTKPGLSLDGLRLSRQLRFCLCNDYATLAAGMRGCLTARQLGEAGGAEGMGQMGQMRPMGRRRRDTGGRCGGSCVSSVLSVPSVPFDAPPPRRRAIAAPFTLPERGLRCAAA